MNTASSRLNIERLLKQSCGEKCLRGGSGLALRLLDEAEAASKTLDGLQELWLAAIQYRKAHLLMRVAGAEDMSHASCSSLAHQLFLSASKHTPFAIRGRLYALAAGLRSGDYSLDAQPAILSEVFQLVGTSAVDLRSLNPNTPDTGVLDGVLANLLELTAYYWGTWDSALEGISLDPLFPNGEKSEAWILFGNDLNLSRVRLEKSFAHAELDALLKNDSFYLAVKESDHGEWMAKTKDSDWECLTGTVFMPLLAALLSRRQGSLHTQLASHPERTDPANLRQRKKRLKELLAGRTGFDANTIVIASSEGEIINPELKIYGITRETTVYQGRQVVTPTSRLCVSGSTHRQR